MLLQYEILEKLTADINNRTKKIIKYFMSRNYWGKKFPTLVSPYVDANTKTSGNGRVCGKSVMLL